MDGYGWARIGFWCGAGIITVTSVLPADAMVHINLWDKLQHALSYGGVAALGAAGYGKTRTRLAIALGLTVLGAGLEAAQIHVPGRAGEVGDALANAIGVVVGLVATSWLINRMRD